MQSADTFKYAQMLQSKANETVWLPAVMENKPITPEQKDELIREHLDAIRKLNDARIIKTRKTQRDNSGKPVEKYPLHIDASKSLYVPAPKVSTGRVANLVQGRIIGRGADQGETNYKTRKMPSKYGEYEVAEVGTFVANKHYDKDIEGDKHKDPITGKQYTKPTKELVADGDGETKILKLGKSVRRKNALGWDAMFGKAAEHASRHLKDGTAFIFKTQTSESQTAIAGIVQSEAGNAKVSSARRTL